MATQRPQMTTKSSKELRLALGQRLRLARDWAGFSAVAAAELINRSESALRTWERGLRQPTLAALRTLAAAYQVQFGWLQSGEGEGPTDHQEPLSGADLLLPFRTKPELAFPAIQSDDPHKPLRYRLVCPGCGKPFAPEILGKHLVTGKSCSKPHSFDEAEELLHSAHRDPIPWLEELVRNRKQIEDLEAQLKAASPDKRGVYKVCLELMLHWVDKIESLGPEKFEWREGMGPDKA